MPELPDVAVYIESLEARVVGHRLERILLKNPFLLRTAEPPLQSCEGHAVSKLRRLGKRIAIGFDNDVWLVIHLMIAGRLHWYEAGHRGKIRGPLLQLDFDNGALTLTEAGTKRRASLHVVAGEAQLEEHDRGGLEVLGVEPAVFRGRMSERNHTLKRALTDPTILSGIGNAYSDEILHRARLSPMIQTKQLDDDEWRRLYDAVQEVLTEWIERLRAEATRGFPEKVTAFRKDMAVHGKFGEPCPVCGTAVQRIRYAENETNYCPRCQTGGKLLADRALSRLLKDDWPRTIDALENAKRRT
ncbi:Fpg/Nei family DNA glycosylase [Steroidobacter agaridevorans]|uniref:Fpg/Nei family DNA glycosylase n=1 Tax=Steroidobacter agaridevorans TaxID=2695856 RepID=UPI001329A421|nr:DNA-formamidopyrimidine glycosylase family protein [Steroidobacter agaridevorans]GFE89073.1 formamidopyrimidine-DNA glycosylase [Steroidobacter agaridevorans]